MADPDQPVNISVLIPSRGRPERLATFVQAVAAKASGKHTLRYAIGCDADDGDTIAMALALRASGLPVFPYVGTRPPSLGGLVNKLAERVPGDVYCTLGDDGVVKTDGWDDAVAQAWRAKPDGVWWWRCTNNAAFPVVSEKWRAAAGRLFTDYFPFWYDDVWLIEVWRYATGSLHCLPIEAWLDDRASGTHRMRDLQFWDDFFWSRRYERREAARLIAARLGWPSVPDFDALDVMKNTNFNADDLEVRQGDRNPPTPEYLGALSRARALMQQKEAA